MRELNEAERRAVFAALVEAEDGGLNEHEARRAVAAEFGLTADEVRAVELEGEREDWPPLGE